MLPGSGTSWKTDRTVKTCGGSDRDGSLDTGRGQRQGQSGQDKVSCKEHGDGCNFLLQVLVECLNEEL